MITITRRLEFDYGHRVWGHEGKCRSPHGHRGVAEITVQAPSLDGVGRVVDFSVVKELVGGWIDSHWDHCFLVHPDDPLRPLLENFSDIHQVGRPVYVMKSGNPTAERMAEELYHVTATLLPTPLQVVQVRLWETPSSFADYRQ